MPTHQRDRPIDRVQPGDAKATENPYWYVSSYGPYSERDLEEFWAAGPRIWRDLCEAIGYAPLPGAVVKLEQDALGKVQVQ